MVTFLLSAVFALALTCAFVAAMCIRAGAEYDAWVDEFNKEGIKTALEPVLQGTEVLGYTLVTERRARPR